MKMRKPTTLLVVPALIVGMFAFVSGTAFGQSVLYQDNTGNQNANFNYGNGSAGNEVILAGSAAADLVTSISFQFDLEGNGTTAPSGTEALELTLYKNDGALVSGYASPGTVLYSSGFISLSSLGLSTFTSGSVLTFSASDLSGGVIVPQDFTWIVTFENIPANELAGLSQYSPLTQGKNYGDAWVNTGSGWTLDVAQSGAPPLTFGATISGTAVPEPSTWMLLIATASVGLLFNRKLIGLIGV